MFFLYFPSWFFLALRVIWQKAKIKPSTVFLKLVYLFILHNYPWPGFETGLHKIGVHLHFKSCQNNRITNNNSAPNATKLKFKNVLSHLSQSDRKLIQATPGSGKICKLQMVSCLHSLSFVNNAFCSRQFSWSLGNEMHILDPVILP